MFTLHRSGERQHIRRTRRDVRLTFPSQERRDAPIESFAALASLTEDVLSPGACATLRPLCEYEIVTYVLAGSIVMKDSTGRADIVLAGEFQRTAGSLSVCHGEGNASRTEEAHMFQIWLHPPETGLEPSHEQKRFSTAQRRGVLCVVASPDGRRGSLRIHQDAVIHSAILSPGQHLVHELPPWRSAWLQVLLGDVRLGDAALGAGDSAGITAERVVSLTATAAAELLLIDLSEPRMTPRDAPPHAAHRATTDRTDHE